MVQPTSWFLVPYGEGNNIVTASSGAVRVPFLPSFVLYQANNLRRFMPSVCVAWCGVSVVFVVLLCADDPKDPRSHASTACIIHCCFKMLLNITQASRRPRHFKLYETYMRHKPRREIDYISNRARKT